MRCACIDIGTNTTRVLVAEARDGTLNEVFQERAFTSLGRGLTPGGTIPADRIEQAAALVAAQHERARRAGATRVLAVATAVIRRAANREEFCAAIAERGIELQVLDGEQEARFAFLGATAGRTLTGRVAVVDVGGGSTELAVGTVAGGVEWAASYDVGSGVLADAYLHGDPPTRAELAAVRAHARAALAAATPGPVEAALAVGGSAASLTRLVGDVLDTPRLERALTLLAGGTTEDVAARFDLHPARVRVMPAGLLALDAAAQALGRPLQLGCGGLREGVLLALADS